MTLTEAREHVNEGVVYNPHGGPAEDGVITWVSDRYVFVLYSGDLYSKATDASTLTLLATGVPE
jgi:hypothetical protein